MSRGSATQLEDLRAKYPIGGCSVFPDKRVYSHMLGGKAIYWELTVVSQ